MHKFSDHVVKTGAEAAASNNGSSDFLGVEVGGGAGCNSVIN